MRIFRFKTALLLATLSTTANVNAAVNLHAEAGEKFTDLSASFGANDPGLTFNGSWGHSDDDGDVAGLRMGFNLPLGPVLFTVGGKALYLNPKDGDEGYAVAVGGGAQVPLDDFITVFGDYYYSPDSFSSGVEDYVEANAGVRLKVIKSMNIEAGYRYIDMPGKNGHRDNTLADGAYAGFNFSF
ncbi:YfaZ family outer membrane protein [Scandinavium sp.]|uniref:YfaZ family outer membrane protein n=1 Tax=Scandinavium sp. TaxID=2830653 RepID=UPI00289B3546|nr:YfaZ family outer membrane protein [Scandinavium sp.]